MSYQIIARKYRPKNFSEVIGQDKIVTILQNALKKNRLGQAYLFSGPRGVGKTTTARILVKYLNCEGEGEILPCNRCGSCDEINRGISLDYLEIDGASNRGIDQIRALNEQLAFASPTGKYRVFVIDEVHMLTHEAFNALLKSLEEPPNKIIFVLCTTESYRIPLTIRSRCQQLFFTNINLQLTEKHLESILTQEKIPFAPHSLWELARKAEGSIRDAENLLEKVIAFNDEKEITLPLVQEVLGETPTDKKYLFLTQLSEENLKSNLELINRLNADGYNLSEFFHNLIHIFSHLVYYKSGVKDPQTLGVSQEEIEQIKVCEKLFSLNEIFTLTDILFDFIHTLKNTTHRSTLVQYFLIKLHRYRKLISPGELKENILKLSRYTLPDKSLSIPPDLPTLEEDKPITVRISPSQSPPIPSPDKPTDALKSSDLDEVGGVTEVRKGPANPMSDPALSTKSSSTTETPQPRPSSSLPWTAKDYQTFLQFLKDSDVGFFRIVAAFPFRKMEGENLILENRNALTPERVADCQTQLEAYLNQPTLKSHPQLKPLIDGRHFKIIIQENLVESNLRKIKQIFPLDE